MFRPGDEFTSTDVEFYEQAVVQFCERDDINIKFIITGEINNPIRQQLSQVIAQLDQTYIRSFLEFTL